MRKCKNFRLFPGLENLYLNIHARESGFRTVHDGRKDAAHNREVARLQVEFRPAHVLHHGYKGIHRTHHHERLFGAANRIHALDGSRKNRIAKGSGTELNRVNAVLKQYEDMKLMFKKVGEMAKKQNNGGTIGSNYTPPKVKKKRK